MIFKLSDSPQRRTPPETFYSNSSHETIERLHHAYHFDFRLFGYSSISYDKVARGTAPEIFRNSRERRELEKEHEAILRNLELEQKMKKN